MNQWGSCYSIFSFIRNVFSFLQIVDIVLSVLRFTDSKYPSGAPAFNLGFYGVDVTRSLFQCVIFCRSLFVLLSFFLLAIMLSVLLRFTNSDYPFGFFKLFLLKMHSYEIVVYVQTIAVQFKGMTLFLNQYYRFCHIFLTHKSSVYCDCCMLR